LAAIGSLPVPVPGNPEWTRLEWLKEDSDAPHRSLWWGIFCFRDVFRFLDSRSNVAKVDSDWNMGGEVKRRKAGFEKELAVTGKQLDGI